MTDLVPLSAEQLGTYFAFMETGSLLQHAVEQQLQEDGGLSNIQFQILATLNETPGGRMRMTDIADRLVYSRSAMSYQAGLLVKAGLLMRASSPEDDRSVIATLTDEGRARLEHVLPGHVDLVRQLLFVPLSADDIAALGRVMRQLRDRMRTAPPRSAAPRPGRAKP